MSEFERKGTYLHQFTKLKIEDQKKYTINIFVKQKYSETYKNS